MDKVYIRILSVSLLISFCGAGIVSPDVYRVALLKEVEVSHCRLSSSNSLSKLFASQPEVSSVRASRRGWGGLRSVLTSLSSRLASLCFGAKSCEAICQSSGDVSPDGGGFGCQACGFSCSEPPAFANCDDVFYSAPQGEALHVEFLAVSCPVRAGPWC